MTQKEEELLHNIELSLINDEVKKCPKCKVLYEINEGFHKGQGYCKYCQRETNRLRYLAKKEEINKKAVAYRQQPEIKMNLWAKRHALSSEDIINMWESQNKACAICKNPITIYQLDGRKENGAQIDHDHSCCPERKGRHYSCGKCVRGLLCMLCNHALGSTREQIDILESMIEYLTKRKFNG